MATNQRRPCGTTEGNMSEKIAQREAAHALLQEAQEALDVLAGDIEDIYPSRAEAAAELAMRCRIELAKAARGEGA